MRFGWDATKHERNRRERGFGFDYAAGIFAGPTLEKRDQRRDYGELRVQAIGGVGDDIPFVVYTDRGEVRHLISARLANRKERQHWLSFVERLNRFAD